MDNIVRNKLSKKLQSLSFDKDDLKKLLDTLQLRADTACDIECKKIESLMPSENIQKAKDDLKSCAPIKVTILDYEGQELFGSINEVFGSVSFPESIQSVYLNTEIAYRTYFKYYPENFFQLFIDFSKPKVFDFSFKPSEKTPNSSLFEIQGSDSTLVNGVFHEITSYIENKPSKFSNIHKGSIYDLLVWFVGIPFGFWVCHKLLGLGFFNTHIFLQDIFLTYCFFLSLFILRVVFHYFRWVFPMIEYKSKKSRSIGHQIGLAAIGLSAVATFLVDIIKLFYKIVFK